MNDILARLMAHMSRGFMDAAGEGAGGTGGEGTADSNPDAKAAEAGAEGDDKSKTEGKTEGGDTEGVEPVLGSGTGKADDNADGDEGKSKEEADDGAGEEDLVPEADYAFTFPDGVEPDAELLSGVSPVFKELGLGQKAADKLVQAYVGVYQAKMAEMTEAHVQTIKDWTSAAKADKEFGGDKYAANVVVANSTLEQFGTPELTKLLIDTGLSNHPEMIRFFYRAGVGLANDTTPKGDPAAETDVPTEQKWYGKTTPMQRG